MPCARPGFAALIGHRPAESATAAAAKACWQGPAQTWHPVPTPAEIEAVTNDLLPSTQHDDHMTFHASKRPCLLPLCHVQAAVILGLGGRVCERFTATCQHRNAVTAKGNRSWPGARLEVRVAGEVDVLQAGEGRQDGRDALEAVEGEVDGPQAPQEGRQQARHVGQRVVAQHQPLQLLQVAHLHPTPRSAGWDGMVLPCKTVGLRSTFIPLNTTSAAPQHHAMLEEVLRSRTKLHLIEVRGTSAHRDITCKQCCLIVAALHYRTCRKTWL